MLKIEIIGDPRLTMDGGPTVRDQVATALDAIGFERQVVTRWAKDTDVEIRPQNEGRVTASEAAGEAPAIETASEAAGEAPAIETASEAALNDASNVTEDTGTRRKRRTKAEIEADRAAEAAKQNISAQPENRVDPATAAQDKADEKAESDASPSKEKTLDDVRNALGRYIEKFGMPAVQEDGPRLFAILFPDTKPTKLSEFPDGADLKKVVEGIDEMLEKNPFDRTSKKG